MKIKLTLITLLLLTALGVKAQTDTVAIMASRLVAAEQLIKTTGMTDYRFASMRLSLIKSLSTSVPEKNRDKFTADMTTFFNKYLPLTDFKDKFIKMYAQIFTEGELKQLITFYSSPLGKKLIDKTPEVMEKGALLQQQVINEHRSELYSIVAQYVNQ